MAWAKGAGGVAIQPARPGAKHFPVCESQEDFVVLVLPPAVAKIAHQLSKYIYIFFCLSLYFLYPNTGFMLPSHEGACVGEWKVLDVMAK